MKNKQVDTNPLWPRIPHPSAVTAVTYDATLYGTDEALKTPLSMDL